MKRAGVYLEIISDKAVKVIAFWLLGVLTWWTASYTCFYPMDYSAEYLQSQADSPAKNIMVAGMVLLLFLTLSHLLLKKRDEEGKKKLVWYFAIFETLLIGISLTVWVTLTQFEQSRDAAQVYGIVMDMLQGDYGAMESNYIQGFQQQLNLVFLEELVLRIGGDYRVFQYLNVICIMGMVFCLYRITDKLFHNQLVNLYCLVSVAGFVPMYLYTNLVYGDVCSISLSIVGIWALLCWRDRKGKQYVAVMIICFTLATLARKNTLIILVAVFICLAVDAWKEWEWRGLLVGFLLAATLFGSMRLIPAIYEKRSGVELGDAMPALMWVNMGLKGEWGGHGTYDASNESLFWATGGNAAEAKQLAVERIRNRLQEFKEDPAMARDFYKNKMLEQWGETTYGSMILTYDEDAEKSPLVEAVYEGALQGKIMNYQNYYSFVIYFGVLLFLGGRLLKKDGIWQLLLMVVVIGGVLFSILWETKSRYVFPYVICMIPYMAYGFWNVQRLISGCSLVKTKKTKLL